MIVKYSDYGTFFIKKKLTYYNNSAKFYNKIS